MGRFGRRFAPQTQLGQLFGASLSIAAIPGQADKYLVAIGAPGYDPGPNANADANVVLGPGNTANGPPWPASGSGNPAQFDCENETNVSAPGYANCNRGLVAIDPETDRCAAVRLSPAARTSLNAMNSDQKD